MFDPPAIPTPPKPPNPPQFGQSNIGASANAYSTAQKGGIGSTIMTSPMGDLNPVSTTKKTLLGQ